MTSVRFKKISKRISQNSQLLDSSFSSITEIVSIMKKVDIKASEVQENAKSMDDNNGKRIKYKVVRVKK